MIEGGGGGVPAFPDLDDAGILIHADPEAIAEQAWQLRATASSVAALARQLVDVQRAGTWDSPAGDTFAREVGSVPFSLEGVADRLEAIAEIFARYSDSLAAAVEELVRIGRRHRAAVHEDERILVRLTHTVTEEERIPLEARRDALAQEIAREALAFRARAEEATLEETRVRGLLATEVPDRLDDSWFYNTVTGAETIGDAADGLATVPFAGKAIAGPLAAGSALGWAGSVTKKAVYDQGGSWRSVIGQGPRKLISWGLGKGGGVGRELADAPARQVARDRAQRVWAPPARPAKPVNPPPAPPYRGRHAQHRDGLRGWGDRRIDTVVRTTRQGVVGGMTQARRHTGRVASEQSGLTLARTIRADWAAVSGSRRTARGVVAVTGAGRVADHVDTKRRQVDRAHARATRTRSGDDR